MEVSGRIHDPLEHSTQEKKNMSLPGNEPRPRGFPAHSLVTSHHKPNKETRRTRVQ